MRSFNTQRDPEKAKELRHELKRYSNYAALFTPIVKAYATEIANEVAYDGVQIHGGTGFMREFNAERHYRDARITNIYEGTTQLQVVAAISGIITGTAMERIHKEVKMKCDIITNDIKSLLDNHDLILDGVNQNS